MKIKYVLSHLTLVILAFQCMLKSSLASTDLEKKTSIEKMVDEIEKKFKVPQIEANDLSKLMGQKEIVLVDVRTEKERQVSIIKGAISEDEFLRQKEKLRNKTIVGYCTIGYRSSIFVKSLMNEGFKSIFNLRGSILLWTHAGQSVVNAQGQETNKVHVYGKAWDLLPEKFKGIH